MTVIDSIDVNIEPYLQRIRSAIQATENLAKEARESGVDISRAFTLSEKDIEDFTKEAREAAAAVDDIGDEAKESQREVTRLGQQGQRSANQFNAGLNNAGRGLGRLGGITAALGPAIAGAFSIAAVSRLTKEIFNVTAEFDKYRAVLENTLGSSQAATASFELISDFASTTPFQIDELTESYIKLVNRGFQPTREELVNLGDLAASQGKSFDQLAEAVLDAQTGEFERLKEFGIIARQNGDEVALSFKGQTVEVEKTDEAIRNAILSFGEFDGVAGSTAAISETLGGRLSNVQDQFTQLLAKIGEGTRGVFASFLEAISRGIGFISSLIDQLRGAREEQGFFARTIQTIVDQFTAWSSLFNRVIGAFQNLIGESPRLRNAINQIGDAFVGVRRAISFIPTILESLFNVAAVVFNNLTNVVGQTASNVRNVLEAAFDLATLIRNPDQFGKNIAAALKATIKPIQDISAEIQEAATRPFIERAQREAAQGIIQNVETQLSELSTTTSEAASTTTSATSEESTEERTARIREQIETEIAERQRLLNFVEESRQEGVISDRQAAETSLEIQRQIIEQQVELRRLAVERGSQQDLLIQEEGQRQILEAEQEFQQFLIEQQIIRLEGEKLRTEEGTAERLEIEVELIRRRSELELNDFELTQAEKVRIVEQTQADIDEILRQSSESEFDQTVSNQTQFFDNEERTLTTTLNQQIESGEITETEADLAFNEFEIERLETLRQAYLDYGQDITDIDNQLRDTRIANAALVSQAIQEGNENDLEDLEKLGRAAGLLSGAFKQMADAAEEGSEEQEQLARTSRALATAQVVLNTVASIGTVIQQAGKAPDPITAVITIAAITSSLVAAAAALRQNLGGFKEGGWTGEGSYRDQTGDKVAGVVHEREYVIRKEYAKENFKLLEAVNNGDISKYMEEVVRKSETVKSLTDELAIMYAANLQLTESGVIPIDQSNVEPYNFTTGVSSEVVETYQNRTTNINNIITNYHNTQNIVYNQQKSTKMGDARLTQALQQQTIVNQEIASALRGLKTNRPTYKTSKG